MNSLYILFLVVFVTYVQSDSPPQLFVNGTFQTFTAEVNTRFSDLGGNGWYWAQFKAYDDLIAAFMPIDVNWMSVLKRNSTGGYNLLTSHKMSSGLAKVGGLDTNGEWFSATFCAYSVGGYSKSFELFRMAENGTIFDIQQPTLPTGVYFEYSRFHSDGSIVGIGAYIDGGQIAAKTKSAEAYRFQLVNGTWTMTDRFVFSQEIRTYSEVGNIYYNVVARKASFYFSDNYLIAGDGSNIYIFEQTSNATSSWIWTIKDSFYYGANPDSISWNGDDAVMVGSATSDTIYIFTKNESGVWNRQDSVFKDGRTFYGFTSVALDKDTFLVSAAIYQNSTTGKVFVIQRPTDSSSSWAITGAWNGPNKRTFFGATVDVTDTHILVDGDKELHAIPRCYVESDYYNCPASVTLPEGSCNDFSNFDASLVCTAKDASSECSSLPITTNVTDISVENETTFITFKMTRFGSAPREVTVGIQCTKPGSPSNQPSGNNGTPSSSNSPNNNNGAPSSSPRGFGSITSSSNMICISQTVALLSLFILGIVSLRQ